MKLAVIRPTPVMSTKIPEVIVSMKKPEGEVRCIPSRNPSYAWAKKNPSVPDYAMCLPVPPISFTNWNLPFSTQKYTGFVTNWYGDKMIPGVTIKITQKSGTFGVKEKILKSDSSGNFIVELVKGVEYLISADKEGYKPSDTYFVAKGEEPIALKMQNLTSSAEVVPTIPKPNAQGSSAYVVASNPLVTYGIPVMIGVVVVGGAIAYMLSKQKQVQVQTAPAPVGA